MRRATHLAAASLCASLLVPASGCAIIDSATRQGMMPILQNGVDEFISEPDLTVAEGAIVANLKLIEGVARTYPGDSEPAIMASMARANYAFGFIQDDIEAISIAYPEDSARVEALVGRARANYASGRDHALVALRDNGDFADAIGERGLSDVPPDEFEKALATLDEDDAAALFWLAFNWGGSLMVRLDPAEATQLPKIEQMVARVLTLDERVFYGAGPNLLAATLYGFRSPALGGSPDKAIAHFDRAEELAGGQLLLARVLKAQYVFAQTEQQEAFEKTLEGVIAAEPSPKLAALEGLAKRKACRLYANLDLFFLSDPKDPPEACRRIPHAFPLRAP